MHKTKSIFGLLLLGAALTLNANNAHAGKPLKPWPSTTLFTFTYTVGTVTNYHAYTVAGQIGTIPQPANTTTLLNWYVLDLGPVSGTGTVPCYAEQAYPTTGFLLFANADDAGNGATSVSNPMPMIILSSGTATIQVDLPPGVADPLPQPPAYPVLYNGPLFSPFSWDFTAGPYPWVWNVEPADWPL